MSATAPNQQPDQPEKDEYERVKEELGYDDEDVRALSKSIKMKALGVLGPAKERKLAFLMRERERRDEKKLKVLSRLFKDWSGGGVQFQPALKKVVDQFGALGREKIISLVDDEYFREIEKAKSFEYGSEGYKQFQEKMKSVFTFLKANDVYIDDVDLMEHYHGLVQQDPGVSEYAHLLGPYKKIYGKNIQRFEEVRNVFVMPDDFHKESSEDDRKRWWENVLNQLGSEKVEKEVGDDIQKLKIFSLAGTGDGALGFLLKARGIYGDDVEKLRAFAEVSRSISDNYHFYGGLPSDSIDAFLKLKELFDKKPQLLQDFCRAAKLVGRSYQKSALAGVQSLAETIQAFAENDEVLDKTLELARDEKFWAFDQQNAYFYAPFFKLLNVTKGIHRLDPKAFESVVADAQQMIEKSKKGYSRQVYGLAGLSDCGDLLTSPENYRVCLDIAEGLNSPITEQLCRYVVQAGPEDEIASDLMRLIENHFEVLWLPPLEEARGGYGTNMEQFKFFAELCMAGKGEAAQQLAKFKQMYGEDLDVLEAVAGIVFVVFEGKKVEGIDALLKGEKVYGKNMEQFTFIAGLIKSGDADICEHLPQAREVYGDDVGKLQATVEYFRVSTQYDKSTLEEFIRIHGQDGLEKAQEYLRNLKNEAKGLIGRDVPVKQRKDPGYRYMVASVFPPGNYSNYENNLACGDQLGHVEGYTFDREGYPTEMSGLKGYKLVEGQQENFDLLNDYQRRLGRMRDFVASRGPDNTALQQAFEKKLDDMVASKAEPRLQEIKGLNLQEKMLALFITEVARKSKQKNYKPDTEILDLIIEYKYAFCENLEGYIQRTADETKRLKDTVSQNFNLWRELSTIYGENLKHVLRHDIFEHLAKEGEHKDEMEAVFGTLIEQEGEGMQLAKKSKERLEAVFDNTKMPEERRFSALVKPVKDLFAGNIRFKNDQQKKQCETEISETLNPCKGNMNKEFFFTEVVPKLFAIKRKYLFDLNAQLEELFGSDINKINEEVAKYEEVVETEKKETRIGGEKHKEVEKKSKKRKIRGFFTKTQETSNARMGAYLCISGDQGMWKNKNYFELVMKEEETGKCVGLAMLLKIEAKDGKKYLWFGPNPFEGFLGQVSSEQCYRYLYDTVAKFAEENGFDGVVVPSEDNQILGACTNRGGDFPDLIKASRLKDSKGGLRIVEFGAKHELGKHGGNPYGYEKGALIWDRETARAQKEAQAKKADRARRGSQGGVQAA